ncbi:uncharacterized protein Triagg1_4112 [Trichoderma aggressivum f. europaeum]|uniref:Uncharacterized protein n=1 Tax=Trichoderma aggressivum f. europaeum TaxID=173218 RepID=A0AAE1IEI8_9HYPO|nr:hypothetical protein Triagg1_4112 [Trichoderma aggressivum f. europaeum]
MSAAKTERKKDVIRFGEKDLNLAADDPRYADGMKCVVMYWAQATQLETREQEEMVTSTLDSSAVVRPNWTTINKPAVATNATITMTVDGAYAFSGTEEQVTVLKPRPNAVEHSLTFRPLGPKRTRKATDNGGFDIDHVVTGVGSSLAFQRFVDAAKFASTTAERPRMTSSDLLEMKEDVKIAKETAMRSEAKLDGFISEMRQFMTAFANTAGIPLPIEVVDESDNDDQE